MPVTPRVTQKHIAEHAGVTQATVSLALKGHPNISPETRGRILQIAEKLGYQPDPYLAGLAAYRQQKREPIYHATLAWFVNCAKPGEWRRCTLFEEYYAGADERARQLGYQLEEHRLREEGMTPHRLEQILIARGISGLLLPPQPLPHTTIDFPWERFSSVTFGYSLASPPLHTVTLHHFRATETAHRKLVSLGYKRIGLVLSKEIDERSDTMLSSAFWSEQHATLPANRIPPFRHSQLNRSAFLEWLYEQKPDVILTTEPETYDWMIDSGIRVPEEIGFAMLTLPDRKSHLSGICENPRIIGAKAVDQLISMIVNGERGIPEVPVCILVEGSWLEGKTLR